MESAARGDAEDLHARNAAHYLRAAALAPAVALDAVETATLSPELTRVTVTVANHGYLPTYVLASARALTHNEPLWADVRCTGCELADPDLAHREIGHLDGWGRGLFDGSGALYYTRTRGTTGARTLSWVVRGRGCGQPADRLVPRRLDDARRRDRLTYSASSSRRGSQLPQRSASGLTSRASSSKPAFVAGCNASSG